MESTNVLSARLNICAVEMQMGLLSSHYFARRVSYARVELTFRSLAPRARFLISKVSIQYLIANPARQGVIVRLLD
jgi:hypothetical protein